MQQKDIPTLKLGDKKQMEASTLQLQAPVQKLAPIWIRHERILQIILSAISLFLFYTFVSLAFPDLSDLYQSRLKPGVSRYWPNALVAMALLGIAYNLFLIRGFTRLWFAVAEMILAMGLGWYATNKAVGGSVQDAIVILFFALYLAGRGFVNISYRFKPLQIKDPKIN